MNPSTVLYFALCGIFFLVILLATSKKKKSKNIKTALEIETKNNLFIINIIKDIQANIMSDNDLENIIEIITANFEKTYSYSTLSSGFIKNSKLIFKTHAKEPVSRAFIDTIKNNMIKDTTATDNEEYLSGIAINELINASINSTADIKLMIDSKIVAVINLSSDIRELYSDTDIKVFSTISDLASGLLTKVKTLLWIEKSKSLAMIDSFSEGIFLIDKNHNLIAMNSSAQNILSIHKDLPTINDVLASLPNTYNFKEKIASVIISKIQIEEKDVTIKDKIFDIIISPVLEIQTKDVLGVSILFHDITLEKSLSQMKKDFTNVMVHELRSPLTAIHASSQFLTSKADLTDFEKNKLLNMISESSRKMLDEISLILDSAKMDSGLFTIRKTESDLKKLITDRINVFTPLAHEKTIKITVNIDENLPKFAFDPTRVDEVINNLLSNSLKFTPINGIIQVTAHRVSGKIVVSVKDSGIGIAKDKQHLLFAKFQQARTDSEHQGTGLGLYVVKGIVEAHGGTVTLESDIGTGTKISFTLPIHKAEDINELEKHSEEPSPINSQDSLVN